MPESRHNLRNQETPALRETECEKEEKNPCRTQETSEAHDERKTVYAVIATKII